MFVVTFSVLPSLQLRHCLWKDKMFNSRGRQKALSSAVKSPEKLCQVLQFTSPLNDTFHFASQPRCRISKARMIGVQYYCSLRSPLSFSTPDRTNTAGNGCGKVISGASIRTKGALIFFPTREEIWMGQRRKDRSSIGCPRDTGS